MCVCVCVRMCVRACACTHCTSLAPYRAGGATQLTRTASVRGTPIFSLPCLLRSSIMACNRPSSQRSGNAKRMSRPEDMHGIHIHICVLESASACVCGGGPLGVCVCACVRLCVCVCVCRVSARLFLSLCLCTCTTPTKVSGADKDGRIPRTHKRGLYIPYAQRQRVCHVARRQQG